LGLPLQAAWRQATWTSSKYGQTQTLSSCAQTPGSRCVWLGSVGQQLGDCIVLHLLTHPLGCGLQGLMERFEKKPGGFMGFDLSALFGQK
jgi:hypothetical protein